MKEYLIVSNEMSVFTFCDESTKKEALQRATASNKKDIELYKKHIKEYDTDIKHYWKNRLEEATNKTYSVMEWDGYYEKQKRYYLKGEPKKITEETFLDMLNVLPPLKWCTINGVEEFLISEFYTGTFTNQYAKKGNEYYTKMVDAFDKKTWIHNLI